MSNSFSKRQLIQHSQESQNQQHIEELKIKLTQSNQSINSLTQQFNQLDNLTLKS
jgi:hypothetical protein